MNSPASAPADGGLGRALRAFKHRDFTVFWLGALVSNIGTWVQNMTVPYVLFEITDSAFWVGFATFCQFIPQMLFGPIGGAIADRNDRRSVLMCTQAAMAVAAIGLWAVWVAGVHNVWVILGLLFVGGIFGGVNIPSWQTFVNDLVPHEDLISAISLNSLQFNASRALGPAIAGIILAAGGSGIAFLTNALSFLFVLLALALVRTRPVVLRRAVRVGVWRGSKQAARYVRGQRGISIGIVFAVLVGALGNPIQQFTVVFAKDQFHVGPLGLALLNVCLGVGAIVAFFTVSGWDHVLKRATMARVALVVYGLAIMSFALAPAFVPALVSLVLVGGGFLAVIAVTNTAIQIIVADHIRGRVLALRIMAMSGSYPIGALIQGWLADIVGVRAVVCSAGLGLLLAGALISWHPAWVLHLDDPHDAHPGLESVAVGGTVRSAGVTGPA